jgi:hypothetical protein
MILPPANITKAYINPHRFVQCKVQRVNSFDLLSVIIFVMNHSGHLLYSIC